MKVLCLLAFVSFCAVWAQPAPGPVPVAPPPAMPNLPDETEVAVFGDGTKLTMGEFRRIYEGLPPDSQPLALRDRAQWLHQWELLRKLTKMAEDAKLDQQSPYRESLAFARRGVLAMAQIAPAINLIVVEPADIVKYYDSNKRKYTHVRVKAIYIAFNDDAAAGGAS